MFVDDGRRRRRARDHGLAGLVPGEPARLLRPRGPAPARAGRARALRRDAARLPAAAARVRRPHRHRARRGHPGGRLQDRPLPRRRLRGQGAVPDALLRPGHLAHPRRGSGAAAPGLPRRRPDGQLRARRAGPARHRAARRGASGARSSRPARPASGCPAPAGPAAGAASRSTARLRQRAAAAAGPHVWSASPAGRSRPSRWRVGTDGVVLGRASASISEDPRPDAAAPTAPPSVRSVTPIDADRSEVRWRLDRALGDAEAAGDLLVGQPLPHQLEHLALACREGRRRQSGRGRGR